MSGVQDILVVDRLLDDGQVLITKDALAGQELGVFHQQVALLRNAVLGTLDQVLSPTEYWQADLVADQVGVARDFNELSMLVSVTKLTH